MKAQLDFADAILERAQRDYRNAPHGQKTAKLKKLQNTMKDLLKLETAIASYQEKGRAA